MNKVVWAHYFTSLIELTCFSCQYWGLPTSLGVLVDFEILGQFLVDFEILGQFLVDFEILGQFLDHDVFALVADLADYILCAAVCKYRHDDHC